MVSPIANAFIYFIREGNQEAIALTVKTDGNGNYDFNLEAGRYIVATSAGGIEQVLANGSLFEITSESQIDAFEKWLNLSNDENVDSALLEKFRELMQRTEAAAQETESAYQKVEETLTTKTDESLKKISERTNVGLSAITIEKNASILEIQQTTTESKESLDQSIENANTAKEDIEQTTQNCVTTIDQKVIEAESQIDGAKDTAIQAVEAAVPDFTEELEKKQDKLAFIGTGATVNKTELDKKRDLNDIDFVTSKNYLLMDRGGGWRLGFHVNPNNGNMGLSIDRPGAARTWNFVTPTYGTLATQEWVNAKISDMSMKKDILNISELEVEAMSKIPFQTFRYREEQTYTNNNAVFFGVIAQKVIKAFKDAGLDATDYNLVVNLKAKEKLSGDVLGHVVGVSYIDLLILEAEVTRRRLKRLEDFMFSYVIESE